MTIDIECITDEVLFEDIKNTDKEARAYRDLWMAFQSLSELPENDPNRYKYDIMKYQSYEIQCVNLLRKLESERDRRIEEDK